MTEPERLAMNTIKQADMAHDAMLAVTIQNLMVALQIAQDRADDAAAAVEYRSPIADGTTHRNRWGGLLRLSGMMNRRTP